MFMCRNWIVPVMNRRFRFVSAIPDVGKITASDFKNILAGRISKIKNEKAKILPNLVKVLGVI